MLHKIKKEQFPKDWNLEHLERIVKRASGHTPSQSEESYWNGGIKWVSLADSNKLDMGYIYSTKKEISKEGIKNSSAVVLPKETVVISRDAGVGKSAVLFEPMAVSQHFIAWECDNQNSINNWYLYYWLQFVKKQIEIQAVGSTIKTIGLSYFKLLKLPHPIFKEQLKIVKIISTWDKSIDTTEKLIKNSEAQKKSLMQQLLTGRKRLSGVFGDWNQYLLGDIGKTYTGLSGKTKDDFGHGKQFIPYMNIFSNIRINTKKLLLVSIKNDEKQYAANYGDIFFTTSSETPNEVGMSSVLLDEVDELYLNSFCFGFRLNNFNTLFPEFAQFLFRSQDFRKQVFRLAQGATRYNLSKKELMKVTLNLPSIEEQKEISLCLNNSEEKISNLKNTLAFLKEEKKALMQQLLNGKRRVKVDKTDKAIA